MGIWYLQNELYFKSKYKSFNGKICEHVFLNEKISNHKNPLYIDKQLVNSYGINIHTINGYYVLNLIFLQKISKK